MKKITVVFLVFILCSGVIMGQNTRSAETPSPPRPQYQAYKKEKKGLFSIFKKEQKPELRTQAEEQAAFRKRVLQSSKENYKAEQKAKKMKRKEARRGELFLGHKRPPKKRPPGKQKFCKICRIKH